MVTLVSQLVERHSKEFDFFLERLESLEQQKAEKLEKYAHDPEKYKESIERIENYFEERVAKLEARWDKLVERIDLQAERLFKKQNDSEEDGSVNGDHSDIADRSNALLGESLAYAAAIKTAKTQEKEAQNSNEDMSTKEVISTLQSQHGFDLEEDVDFEFSTDTTTVIGSILSENISGASGNDVLMGGDGDDVIKGGAGRDIVEGGSGEDILFGGSGIDVFVFRQGSDCSILADFEMGYDILDFEDFGDVTYDGLMGLAEQVGDDVHFKLKDDVLILQNADMSTMVADDLCIR